MVGFGEHLRKEQTDDWSGEYIDYEMLKRKLEEVLEQRNAGNEQIASALRTILQGLFDQQIEKVIAFYSRQATSLSTSVSRAREEVQRILGDVTSDKPGKPEEKRTRVDDGIVMLRERALDITNLMSFVALNMAATRKILKKVAKNLDAEGPRGPGLLTLRVEHPHEPGWKVLQGTFLPAKVGLDLEEMQRHDVLQDLGKQIKDLYEKLHLQHDLLCSRHGEISDRRPSESLDLTRRISERIESISGWKYAPPPLRALRSRAQGSPEDVIMQMDILLEQMSEAERLAQAQAQLVHVLTWGETQAGIWEPPPEDSLAVATFNGLLLNCVNSGLYMANYNLVIPTITALCGHIGVSDSAVGFVIGCCDIATIFGTLASLDLAGYSIWTNTNYKAPMMVSALACIIGNVAYCLSYDARSLTLLVIARLITGFGSARAVNRRYIAMYVARKDRTNASALFVSLSAVGMALGPLLALPLARVPDMQLFGTITIGPITAGGYVVSAAWLIYLVWSLTFQDPLKVLAAREAAASRAQEPDLEQPLLAGEGDEQAKARPPKPPHASELDLTSTAVESEAAGPVEPRTWSEWFAKSPMVPTTCCIFLCFILKVVQQAYIDGLPIFTLTVYGWTSGQCGIMIGVLGLVAPVINTGVGAFSGRLPDRHITSVSILLTGIGAALLMKGALPQWSFFTGGAALFVGTIVLEGISMSLTSKVIDESIASGLFNAGMLSTQAGTIGRLCGNLLLSLCVSITGSHLAQIGHLAAVLFGSALAFMVFSLVYVLIVYRRLIC